MLNGQYYQIINEAKQIIGAFISIFKLNYRFLLQKKKKTKSYRKNKTTTKKHFKET